MEQTPVSDINENLVEIDQTATLFGSSVFRFMKRRILNSVVVGFGDALGLAIAITIAGFLRWWLKGGAMIPEWSWITVAVWGMGGLMLNLLPGWGLSPVEELRRVFYLTIGVFALISIGLFLGKSGTQISRLTLSVSMVIAFPLILLLRGVTRSLLVRSGRWGLPTVIYGSGELARKTLRALEEHPGLGLIPVGIFSDERVELGSLIEGVPIIGGMQAASKNIPAAILAEPDLPSRELAAMLEGPLSQYRRVVMIPNLIDVPSLWVDARDLGGILGLEVSHNLLDPLSRFFKRIFELTLVCITLPAWLPLMGLIGLIIWLEDRHPPIFSQERIGHKNRAFATLKFRTMVNDAETVLSAALDQDPALREEWQDGFKLRRDPRLTRVGRLLRKTSLDELPQLFNVLAGQMSLVGPRPLPRYHHSQLPEQVQRLRERVFPGLTGLWQVSGRSESGHEGMVRWDAYYVRNWSIWLDMVILFRTIRTVIRGSGAY